MLRAVLTDDAELRRLEARSAPQFLANLDRCRAHLAPWVPPAFLATDLDSARRILRRYDEKWTRESGGLWGIWWRGELVGGVMLASLDPVTGVGEVGCWLEATAEGQGLVTRAARIVVDFAVRERGVRRVEWWTKPANARSIRVAQRLGLSRLGPVGQVYPERTDRSEVEIWSVTAGQWLAGR